MKRKLLFAVLVLVSTYAFSSVRFSAVLTPTFLHDGYPLLQDNMAAATADSLENLTRKSWEVRGDSLRRFDTRESLLSAFLEIENGDLFFALKVNIREDLYNFLSFSPKTNIPLLWNTKYAVTHAQYPHVAYLEYDGSFFSFSVGRRLFLLGPGEYSFILSPVQPYLDSASFSLFYNDPAYTLTYSFYAIATSGVVYNPGKTREEGDVMKTFFIHKLQYESTCFILALSELNCVYDTYPSLIDFSPFVFWHNQYQEEHSNVMIEVSVEGRIRDLRLYMIYAQDDLCLKTEGNNYKPTALGFAAGLDWSITDGSAFQSPVRRDGDYIGRDRTLKRDGGIHLLLSAYWATNYLYNRRSSDPSTGKFTSDRYGKITLPYRFYSSYGGYTDADDAYYLGFPYGPGTVKGELGVSYEDGNMFLMPYLSLIMRGDVTIESPVDKQAKDNWLLLQGEIVNVLTLGIKGERILFENCRNFSIYTSSSVSFESTGKVWPLISITFAAAL